MNDVPCIDCMAEGDEFMDRVIDEFIKRLDEITQPTLPNCEVIRGTLQKTVSGQKGEVR